jgi:hypothetical protein
MNRYIVENMLMYGALGAYSVAFWWAVLRLLIRLAA